MDRIWQILQSMQVFHEEEVIRIHSSRDYLIYMLGFLPGFSYLGGLDERTSYAASGKSPN